MFGLRLYFINWRLKWPHISLEIYLLIKYKIEYDIES